MPLLIQYRNLFDSNSQLHEALKLMYVDVLEFHHQALKFFSGNRKSFLAITASNRQADHSPHSMEAFF